MAVSSEVSPQGRNFVDYHMEFLGGDRPPDFDLPNPSALYDFAPRLFQQKKSWSPARAWLCSRKESRNP
jgi:hypothetical protein